MTTPVGLVAAVTMISWEASMVDLSGDDKITLAGITVEGPGIGGGVRNLLACEMARILAQHGPRAFEAPKHAAAIHEAGHVVAHVLAGNRVQRTRIAERRPGVWLGFTETRSRHWLRPRSPAQFLQVARSLYAGYAAERMLDQDFREASSIDEIVMSQLAAAMAANILNTDEETYWQTEVHLAVCTSLGRNGTALKMIAEHLLNHQRLKGRRLDNLCAEVRKPPDGA
jgi:hypothetical protein